MQISIGQPGSASTVAVEATDANPPDVHQIALGDVDCVNLNYQQGSPGASVHATQDGNGYKFTGTATGMNTASPAGRHGEQILRGRRHLPLRGTHLR